MTGPYDIPSLRLSRAMHRPNVLPVVRAIRTGGRRPCRRSPMPRARGMPTARRTLTRD